MSAKSVVKMGFLAMIAATSLLGAVEGFAADTRRVDVIDNIVSKGPVYVYSKSGLRVDVIDSIASEGPVYRYTKVMSH